MGNKKKQKAIFLDRDGVINEDSDYVATIEEMCIYSYTARAISKINQSSYKAIVVTNQSAVARKMITEVQLNSLHEELKKYLQSHGAYVDDIFYCPHHPGENLVNFDEKYIKQCSCRKPGPGMLIEAAKKHNIDLTQSYMIGDSGRDIEAGQKAGCTTIGVHTGKDITTSEVQPDFVFDNLFDAVEFILGK
jgi:D-glycero-D-manno-heptose 1,7-bisphosphate phosphatase